MPGTLDSSDLSRLCPAGQDVLAWAEMHLRAVTDSPLPALVPARHPWGHCHWYFEGRCAVHDNAPFGCAFFDSHMSQEEIETRAAIHAQAIRQDIGSNGLYVRTWRHLVAKGLTCRRGDRGQVDGEVHKLLCRASRSRQRARDR
jgi:hypothetical protein